MRTNEISTSEAARNAGVAKIDMKLEVVVMSISGIDRAKEFYERIGPGASNLARLASVPRSCSTGVKSGMLAGATGLEPAVFRVTGRRSNQGKTILPHDYSDNHWLGT